MIVPTLFYVKQMGEIPQEIIRGPEAISKYIRNLEASQRENEINFIGETFFNTKSGETFLLRYLPDKNAPAFLNIKDVRNLFSLSVVLGLQGAKP